MTRKLPVVLGLGAFGLALGLAHLVHADVVGLDHDDGHDNSADATQTRQLPAFHTLELAGTLEVKVVLGQAQSVSVVGESQFFANVITTVKDGALVIDTKFPHQSNVHIHHLKVVVTAPDLSALVMTGTGEIKASGVANQALMVNLPGTGEIKIEGATGTLKVNVDGTGDVSAKQLTAKAATIAMNGTGSASVFATDDVDASVTGTGSIKVSGHPARVHKSVTGLGSISIK